ncbi:hypothetical protein [Thermogutta sp.]|uniref:hypothetical protein n=1 Tax=Thermogutta sp. TaxID=1962930 RepID=UPI00321F7053
MPRLTETVVVIVVVVLVLIFRQPVSIEFGERDYVRDKAKKFRNFHSAKREF